MRVRWLPDAVEDLAGISHYLALHYLSFRQTTMVQLYEGVRSLGAMPYRGRPGATEGTRELVFSRLPYIVTYRVRHDTVEVLYIRHAAQEPEPS